MNVSTKERLEAFFYFAFLPYHLIIAWVSYLSMPGSLARKSIGGLSLFPVREEVLILVCKGRRGESPRVSFACCSRMTVLLITALDVLLEV